MELKPFSPKLCLVENPLEALGGAMCTSFSLANFFTEWMAILRLYIRLSPMKNMIIGYKLCNQIEGAEYSINVGFAFALNMFLLITSIWLHFQSHKSSILFLSLKKIVCFVSCIKIFSTFQWHFQSNQVILANSAIYYCVKATRSLKNGTKHVRFSISSRPKQTP